MNVLVVGRGGREHSLMTHLKKSQLVRRMYGAPRNGGKQERVTCVNIEALDKDGLTQFAKENKIDLTVVSPESSLNAGIANRFQEENLAIFAPTKEAALLEGSKSFAKDFMIKYDIPTATYATFTDFEKAKQHIEEQGAPIVIKADGLAEGKGVIRSETKEIALEAIDSKIGRATSR